jgi:hypothetical protein
VVNETSEDIVRALAKEVITDGDRGDCVFCARFLGFSDGEKDLWPHKPGCLWLRAAEWAKKNP